MSLSELLELKQVVSGLIGALLALVGQSLTRRVTRARTARRLSVAFWEELSAVNFYGPDENPNFAGFSSQTFDTLFREVAETLPESLARDLMRYHWRMKYMEDMKDVTIPATGGVQPKFCMEARELSGRLLQRLKHHGSRQWISLLIRPAETCASNLLLSAKGKDAG